LFSGIDLFSENKMPVILCLKQLMPLSFRPYFAYDLRIGIHS
jgi:hypothetical protein